MTHAPAQRTERAHAKINLLLRILAREESGYHGVETLLQRVALHDIVNVAVSPRERTLVCDGPAMPPHGLGTPENNLAWKAAERFAEATRWDTGWRIDIDKRIPVGGGLGGGSADAAAVLRAMNAMAPTPLPAASLLEIAGTLGADVPFLVAELSLAFAWNRGDRMLSLRALPQATVELVTFDEGVNTGDAYRAFSSLRAVTAMPVFAGNYGVESFTSWLSIGALAMNDFECVVPLLHSGVARVLPLLQQRACELHAKGQPAISMLSGSGATCFLLHDGAVSQTALAGLGATITTATL